MTKQSATSPFMKTAFVAIILASTSISSASHAEYLLTTAATQGLESQLSLETNPQLVEALRQLELGNCQDPATKLLIEALEEAIKKLKNELKPAKAEAAKLQKQVDDLRKKASAKRDELQNARDTGNRELIQKLEAELTALNNQLTPLLLQLLEANEKVQAIENELNPKEYILKKAKECLEKPKKTTQQR
ncbi:MAG: hypothetical protein ACK502_10960 [Alphaproteobacteria bacterium]